RGTATANLPGRIEGGGEPLTNPVTGETHRARINLPDGFEYDIAEVGRGWAETQAPLAITLADSHAQFAVPHMNQGGVVHGADRPLSRAARPRVNGSPSARSGRVA